MHISILALDGCPASSVSGPLELFQLAKSLLPADTDLTIELLSASAHGGNTVQCSSGLGMIAHGGYQHRSSTDLVLIGAIGYPTQQALDFPEGLLRWLTAQYESGAQVASICTGAFVLAATGLLSGKSATTHWRCTSLLQEKYPDIQVLPSSMITDSGRLVTAGGASAYQDVCLYLIRKMWGVKLAQACAKLMLIDLDRESQSRYAQFDVNRKHQDRLVHQAQDWIGEHLLSAFQFTQLAAHCHISERQLKRRFKAATGVSLLPYVQTLRIEWSKQQLELTNDNVDVIARSAGYEDMRFFRELFKRHTSMTPTEYRNKFRMRL